MSERSYVILGILSLLVAALILAYTTIANTLSTEGAHLSELENETKEWHNKNLELEDQYLHDAAYTTIEEKARGEGFRSADACTFYGYFASC